MTSPSPAGKRFLRTVRDGASNGIKTTVWLLSIMLPVSFAVFLLQWFNVLQYASAFLEPVFAAVRVDGSGALVFLSGVLINLYSAIATMAELSLDLREVTILALMGLTAHNFLVEIAVLSSGSSNAARMTILRLLGALLVGVALGRILPESLSAELPAFGLGIGVGVDPTGSTFGGAVAGWAVSAGQLVARVALIVVLLMIGEQLLRDYGVTGWLSRRSRPLMRVFGLPDNVAFLWAVSNTLGLAYGAGVLRRELKGGEISERDGDLFCHHVALSHSLLEDTLLFVGLGVPALWLIVPRLVLAIVAVWERRLELHVRSKRCRRV